MKFNISNMTVALAAAALGAASCTANYEDINRNPYEVTAEDMERDGYAMRSFMTTMQSWVIPADVNQCQFTDLLLGGPYGGYIADANSGFNTGKFSTYDPQSNWSPVFYRVIYTNEMSNFTELCKVTEDENAIAVAKVVKVAGVHRVADTYGPIPYTQVGTGADPVPLDSEKEVFKAMFADLDAAVEVLTRNRAGMITTDADRLYGGSLERWGRLANSLKLRLAMRIVYTDFTTDDGRTPQQLAEEAVSSELGVIEDNSGNAMYTGFGKDGNPFYVCFFSYKSGAGDHRVAADIASFMNGYDDPRRASYFNESVTIPWNDGAAFEENLERIITQKWIANFPLGTEAWADYRRTGYPRLFPVVVNNNPDITNLQLGARRMTYPLEEYEANGETIRAAVDQWLGGQDKMSTRLWWDCNPRIR